MRTCCATLGLLPCIAWAETAPTAPGDVEEVVVTAQKRSERLLDVPVPVTALNASALTAGNQLRLQDYYASVPGLSLSSDGRGDANLSIRGLTTGGMTNPTVGIMVDDVPYGSTSALASRTSAPDIDPSDLQRIEVLRGPQGTLYGANSIGGLVKFVTVDPSLDGMSARMQVDLNSVKNGDSPGRGLRASINVPLGERFAVRASAYARREAGYVDGIYANDPLLHINGVNDADVRGGRVSALWRVSTVWSVKLSAMYQDIDASGRSNVTLAPPIGELSQNLQLRRGEAYRHKIGAYSATVSGDFAGMTFTALSGFSTDKYGGQLALAGFNGAANFLYPGSRALEFQNSKTNRFTQEVRLSGTGGSSVEWLVGAFYTHEDSPTHDIYIAVDPVTLENAGPLLDDPYPTTYAEYAAFGDATFKLSDRFDVQVGARVSENRQVYEETIVGPLFELFGLPSPSINPPVHTRDTSTTYLFTPRFRVSTDMMAYARFATGYRPGGPNPTCVLFTAPCEYGPDKTLNYELGLKGEVLDHRLSFDTSIYHIDWKDIQLQLSDPLTGATYYTNASKATSRGIEASTRALLGSGVSIEAWAAWNDAKLKDDLPATSTAIGFSGDRLPYSSRLSAHLSLDKEFAVSGTTTVRAGGSVSYVGARKANFSASADQERLELPHYVLANVRLGVRYDSWDLNLYANNLADKRGALSMAQAGPRIGANFIQPRTVGVSLAKDF